MVCVDSLAEKNGHAPIQDAAQYRGVPGYTAQDAPRLLAFLLSVIIGIVVFIHVIPYLLTVITEFTTR